MPGRTLDQSPNILALYAKAALSSLPLPGRERQADGDKDLTGLQISLHDVIALHDHVARYREVCGFAPGGPLPATYPHVLAFPLHLALMTDARFPFPAVGAVHISNTIHQHRPLEVDEPLSLEVVATDLRPHSRGRQITLVTTCTADGSLVWRSESVILHRESTGSDQVVAAASPEVPEQAPTGPLVWKLPSRLGRQYASVSGDRNPIHLYDVTALALGFKHHIAHGMWSKARCLGELSNRVPEAFSVSVAFKKPINLPGSVTFGARRSGSTIDFGLTSRSGSPHLLGRISPL